MSLDRKQDDKEPEASDELDQGSDSVAGLKTKGGPHQHQRTEEEYKAAELHIETLNMMAKYQLVFVKLEASVNKLAQIRKSRQKLALSRALETFRNKVAVMKRLEGLSAGAALQRLRAAIVSLVGNYSRVRMRAKERFVAKWRLAAEHMHAKEKAEKVMKEQGEKWKKELGAKEQTVAQLELKIQQKSAEVLELRESEASLKALLKEREDKEKALRGTIEKFRRKSGEERKLPKSAEDRLRELESHIKLLENDNKSLKEQIESTEGNVESFVQEISELIDSEEFAKLRLEEDEGENEEVMFGGGTGESSKDKEPAQPTRAPAKRRAVPTGNNAIVRKSKLQL